MSERILPRITYDPALEEAPYQVRVHLKRVVDLLGEQGMSNNKIGKLYIHLERGSSHSYYYGDYNPFRRTISLYIESHWDEYLSSSNPDTIKKFTSATNDSLNNTLLHELTHYLDYSKIIVGPFATIASSILNTIFTQRLVDRFDPLEKRARKFANELLSDARWQRLVILTPKPKSL